VKLAELKPVVQPKPVEKRSCLACRAFAAECLVPVGDGAVPMCWLCAHHVVDHGVPLHEAPTACCECLPHEVYPGRSAPVVAVAEDAVRN